MERILIFGTDDTTGQILKQVFGDEENLVKYGIFAFVENVKNNDTFLGLPVFLPRDLKDLQFDKIVIVNAGDYALLRDELAYGYGIEKGKITTANYLIRIKIINDYRNGSIAGDAETEQTIRQLENAENFNLWCGYCSKPKEKYEVIWDEVFNMPYVIFDGKKMYFPRNKRFKVENGKQYVTGLEFEQQEGSPHTYITDDICVREGDVLVDAGVCEGNFAIKYIDKVSKLYLIECNPAWLYPLKLTFREYLDKIVFCSKFLGKVDGEKTTTLDSLIGDDRVDFIKMDIEGAEVGALQGAEKVFRNNDIRCSICAYHRHNDEKNIRNILESYGYTTSTSFGHMIFPHDKERFKWSELRHGIVYGRR